MKWAVIGFGRSPPCTLVEPRLKSSGNSLSILLVFHQSSFILSTRRRQAQVGEAAAVGTNKMAVPPTVSAAAAVPYENIHSGHEVGILKEIIKDSVNRVVMFVNEHDSKCLKTATSPVC